MTDEEKAHNFAISLNCTEMKMGELMALRQGSEIGYLNGLAEGRKEKEIDIFDRWCREEGYECQFLEKLKKENEELKKELESWKKRATDTYLEQ